jgi:hypothetical protein
MFWLVTLVPSFSLGIVASSYAVTLPVVSGGTLTSDSTYHYRTFTSNGSFIVASVALSVDIYRVSGGTGGLTGFGGIAGGGGGAGYVSAPISRSALGTYTVSIGAGGASDSAGSSSNVSGSFSPSLPTMPIFPAGGDDYGWGQPCFQVNGLGLPPRNGGSASGSNAGGGAGVNGDGQSRPTGGNGGVGYNLPIVFSVGGGGGGGGSPAGTGSFGGGNGNGGNAAVSTGSGGGGSNSTGGIGGNGGSGIVVFRYLRSAVGG